eukprot:gene2486-3077_t
MAEVNIRRDIEDPYYRYKMQALQAKVEGKGNGVKTVIVNLPTIARDLDRPPEYPTKFFEIVIGSRTHVEGDKYSVGGEHTADKLASILDMFIEKYVLCPQCKNPETKFLFAQKTLRLKCAACGEKSPLETKSKMSGYILKNPPKAPSSKGSTHDEASKTNNTVVKESKKKKKEEEDDDVVWFTDTSQQSIDERKKNAIGESTAVVKAMVDLDINDGEGGEAEEEKEDDAEKDPVEYLVEFLEKNPDDTDKFMKQLAGQKSKFGLRRSYEVASQAIEALGNGSAKQILSVVKTKKPLLAKIAQLKDGQMGICIGFELLCSKDETLLKSLAGALKVLFDEDILSEEPILKWFNTKAKSKSVKSTLQPFIEWLETAEEEDEDDEEDEE